MAKKRKEFGEKANWNDGFNLMKDNAKIIVFPSLFTPAKIKHGILNLLKWKKTNYLHYFLHRN